MFFLFLSPEHHNLLYLGKLLPIRRVFTEVVHEDDLPDEVLGTPHEDAHDSPQEGGARLVVEGDDDGGGGEAGALAPVLGPAGAAPGVRHITVTGDLVTRLLKYRQ